MSESAARVFPSFCVTPIARCTGSTVGIADLIAGVAAIATSSRAIEESDYSLFNCPFSLDSNGQPNVQCQGVLPFGIQIGKSQGLARPRAPISDHRLFDCARAGIDALAIIISESNMALNMAIQSVGGLTIEDLLVLFAEDPENFEDAPSLSAFSLGPVNIYSSGFSSEAGNCSNDQAYVV